jgi:hypothetical protein
LKSRNGSKRSADFKKWRQKVLRKRKNAKERGGQKKSRLGRRLNAQSKSDEKRKNGNSANNTHEN